MNTTPTARAEMVVHHWPNVRPGKEPRRLVGFSRTEEVTFVVDGVQAQARACLLVREKIPLKIKHVDHKADEHHHPPSA